MDGLRSSPMLDQYRRIKKEHTGSILFFRLGDFYEMFADDAVEVSSLLNLTLTSRNGLPMCGVPYHAARSYIARLLKVGKKIAICEQFTAQEKQKIIDRDVVEVITPGTTIDEDFLDKGSSNYLCCLAAVESVLSFSYIDLSTGDFFTTCFKKDEEETLRQELERLQIKEMLIQESLLEEENQLAAAVYDRSGLVLNRWADWLFDPVQARERLEKQFGLTNLKSFGLDEKSPEIISAGTLLDYLDSTAKKLLLHIRTLKVYRESEYLGIDESSQRNLELLANQRDGDVRFSLLEVMDETRCSMGRRLLKRRLLHPLRDLKRINARLDMVENLYRDQGRLSKLRDLLGKTPDLERLCSRLAMDKAHGRDMLAVKNALVSFHAIVELLNESLENMHFENDENWNIASSGDLLQIQNLLDRGICDEPSVLLNEGNLIKSGYSEELDSLKLLKDKGRQFLEEYLEEERETTGITSLKIRYNRLIGYFFEVTNVHLNKVPKHFIRRQGIAGGERYTTDRLASLESDINGASDKLIELEKKLFLEIREQTKKVLQHLAAAAHRIAEFDAAQSLAKAASIRSWTRPVLNESTNTEIREGRHPVVEAHLGRGEYIPNDIILHTDNKDGISFVMITGPNMAGKSTYLRSAALITIMAQAGSFVPASEANIGLCDRIYCRVGASDNLARGESTFLVEMNETAFILNTATEKSLVIMDEVGRGTGTNDGLSIAWAVSEELLNRIKCRTLFATHFHELSLLSHPNLANRSMEVLDDDGKIVFLRKLKEGPAAESYGIHVAKLAGLKDAVLERASQIMILLKKRDSDLTETFYNGNAVNCKDSIVNSDNEPSEKPAAYFSAVQGKIEKLLHGIEPEQMTPLEALNLLCQWKKLVNAGNSENEKLAEKKQKIKTTNKDADSFPSLFD
ncbi:MAG: DNA mismatch repair protein MutS [Spirochaetes bacterium]|nr:DNA mismatch repair protein MutS [Spirochaetota bacterium]